MSRFPRPDYQPLDLYTPDRRPVALDLSDNTNLWGAPPAALAAVQAADDDMLTRYPLLYADDLKEAVRTAVINKRAGGTGLISGRKAFQRPLAEGIALLNAIQNVYLTTDVTIA